MKHLKISLAAVAFFLTIGVVSAAKWATMDQQTYYPVKTGATTYDWEAINPANFQCVTGTAGCSGYTADAPPPANQIPAGYTANGKVLQPL